MRNTVVLAILPTSLLPTSMYNHVDSYESEALKKMILHKKNYLQKLTGDTMQYRILQREIFILENDILPIVLRNTNVLHSEVASYFMRTFDKAIEKKYNGFLYYQPINENFTDEIKIAVANSSINRNFDEIYLSIEKVISDGVEIQPENISI
ncbi:MAG TPA: hypothetical protein PLK02_08160 [Paludibacteraceae bacterium]|nr:hypothetical protein [Paludibacteraceae bacterium]